MLRDHSVRASVALETRTGTGSSDVFLFRHSGLHGAACQKPCSGNSLHVSAFVVMAGLRPAHTRTECLLKNPKALGRAFAATSERRTFMSSDNATESQCLRVTRLVLSSMPWRRKWNASFLLHSQRHADRLRCIGPSLFVTV